MPYVIQFPHSSTNPTDKYTIVLYDNWLAYIHGKAWHLPVASKHDTYEDAVVEKAELNAKD